MSVSELFPAIPLWRKKPLVVEAMQFLNDEKTPALLNWANGQIASTGRHVTLIEWHNDKLRVPTLEGVLTASPGDWVIKGVSGEFYPCKPDIFATTYEPVTSRQSPATGAEHNAALAAENARLRRELEDVAFRLTTSSMGQDTTEGAAMVNGWAEDVRAFLATLSAPNSHSRS